MKSYGEVESFVIEPPFSGRNGGGEIDFKFSTPVSGDLAPLLDKFTSLAPPNKFIPLASDIFECTIDDMTDNGNIPKIDIITAHPMKRVLMLRYPISLSNIRINVILHNKYPHTHK